MGEALIGKDAILSFHLARAAYSKIAVKHPTYISHFFY